MSINGMCISSKIFLIFYLFEILKSIFHIVRTTLQCLASMTDMNGYECSAFISCWHCMEFLIMNQHISK